MRNAHAREELVGRDAELRPEPAEQAELVGAGHGRECVEIDGAHERVAQMLDCGRDGWIARRSVATPSDRNEIIEEREQRALTLESRCGSVTRAVQLDESPVQLRRGNHRVLDGGAQQGRQIVEDGPEERGRQHDEACVPWPLPILRPFVRVFRIEHHEVTGPHPVRPRATVQPVAGSAGDDSDDVFVDRVDAVLGVRTVHPHDARERVVVPDERLVDERSPFWVCKIVQDRGAAAALGSTAMITVHIIVDGADRASAWYRDVFGAIEQSRIVLPDGKLIHVVLDVGGSTMVLADEFPDHQAFSPATTGVTSAVFYLQCDDVDQVWARAVEGGATVARDLADVFWGEREGQLVDPFGHRWGLTQHIRDVSHAEMTEIAAQVFAPASDS